MDVTKAVFFDYSACVVAGITRSYEACTALADQQYRLLLPPLAKALLSPDRACNEELGWCKDPEIKVLKADDYVKKRLGEKPELIKNNTYLNDVYAKIKEDEMKSGKKRPTINSIYIGDVHADFKYKEGAPATCGYPVCCRNHEGQEVKPGVRLAGRWGDYNCDYPHRTFVSMLEFIADK